MTDRVFLTGSGIAAEARRFLENAGCRLAEGDPRDTQEDLIRKFRDFDPRALIVRQGKITAEVQSAARDLRVICKHGVGTDNIDISAATGRGIPVMYTPRANFEAAAEHTLALILSLVRRIPVADRRIRSGIFDKKDYDGLELFGKTLGLIGFGSISRRLAELVSPFNMTVLVYHPSSTDEPLPGHIQKVGAAGDIFPRADILSLHCPLTADTENLIDRDSIARMKPGAFIINTARGGLINEGDLLSALREGHIGGAALDVFAEEPLPENHPFYRLDQIIMTTHIAGMSDNSFKNMGMDAARNVLAVLRGESVDMASVKNKTVFESARK